MNRNNLIIPVVAVLAVGALAFGAVSARAETATGWKESFVSALATKLGVEPAKVDTAVTELRTERRGQMQARFESRLGELVTLGKLTESQKSAVLAKRAELQKEWDAEESKRETHRAEMQSWAAANGIDLDELGPMGMGRGEGRRGQMGR